MLDPFFFQMPNPERLKPGLIYRITGYAQVEEYTLVTWRFGKEDEYATGETLYRDRTLIATGGGTLPLYTPKVPEPVSRTPRPEAQTVMSRVDDSIGRFGVPPAVATALRDPLNYVSFEIEE
ncbi:MULTISPECIES: hypothetical protein [Trichocoleus]|uniref:Uncharacterized protein n=1 Tax=Trichocoleus desertorum GB2-A4 TaxID=2933944 RepID=A0ABV0JCT0_9CYAN|nr:hypothetical protein [Trichocoleus sp. FACHB-46]MBD1864240.1 hypothetical protein [Trichocoleus sp. FACHB-46]